MYARKKKMQNQNQESIKIIDEGKKEKIKNQDKRKTKEIKKR